MRRIGCESLINRQLCVYKPLRPKGKIEADIKRVEGEIWGRLKECAA